MKFIINTKHFASVLTALTKVIPSKSVDYSGFIRFNATPDGVSITATSDGFRLLRVWVPAGEALSVQENGQALIPGRVLSELIGLVTSDEVTLSCSHTSGSAAVIAWDGGRSELPVLNDTRFPVVEDVIHLDENAATFSIPVNGLIDALDAVLYAAGTDTSLRPVLTGVCVDGSGEGVALCASDARKLAACDILGATCDTKDRTILEGGDARLLKSILGRGEGTVSIHAAASGNIIVVCGAFLLRTKSVPGRFPDYRSVIPSNDQTLEAAAGDLCGSVKRATSMPGTTHVTLSVKSDLVDAVTDVSASSIALDSNSHDRFACTFDGDAAELTFDADFLLETVAALRCERVALRLRDGKSAVLFESADTENPKATVRRLAVLMPVRK